MGRSIMQHTAFLFVLLILLSIGGVFATWYYADAAAEDVQQDFSITLSEFEWAPEQILPDDQGQHESHITMINQILNDPDYGVNNASSVLNDYLTSPGRIFSNQKVQGGHLKFIADEAGQLYYCLERISGSIYHAYTFTISDLTAAGEPNNENPTSIPAYRTILEKTDVWKATTSALGYAQTKSLSDFNVDAVSGLLDYSIDPNTWTQNQ